MDLETITEILSNWTNEYPLEIQKPDSGTINDVWIVSTSKRKYVLRRYSHRNREQIEREHKVVTWSFANGIPAVCPIPTRSGNTYLIHQDQYHTLLPFVKGRQVDRKRMTQPEIREMGRFLGYMHGILERCPIQGIPALTQRHEKHNTLARIVELLDRITSIRDKADTDRYMIRRLRSRIIWLESRPNVEHVTTETEHAFPIHGDYQNTNLFFVGDLISAIFDWDKIYRASGAWEVIRAFDLMFRFSPDYCQAFLDGYRQERVLTTDDLDIAAEQYGIMRAYDLWLPTDIYEHGNDRVRQFVNPGTFTPIVERWNTARPALDFL